MQRDEGFVLVAVSTSTSERLAVASTYTARIQIHAATPPPLLRHPCQDFPRPVGTAQPYPSLLVFAPKEKKNPLMSQYSALLFFSSLPLPPVISAWFEKEEAFPPLFTTLSPTHSHCLVSFPPFPPLQDIPCLLCPDHQSPFFHFARYSTFARRPVKSEPRGLPISLRPHHHIPRRQQKSRAESITSPGPSRRFSRYTPCDHMPLTTSPAPKSSTHPVAEGPF